MIIKLLHTNSSPSGKLCKRRERKLGTKGKRQPLLSYNLPMAAAASEWLRTSEEAILREEQWVRVRERRWPRAGRAIQDALPERRFRMGPKQNKKLLHWLKKKRRENIEKYKDCSCSYHLEIIIVDFSWSLQTRAFIYLCTKDILLLS